MPGRLATVVLLALAALVVLATAACGGDSSDGGDGGGGGAQGTPATTVATVATDQSNRGTVTIEAEAGDVTVRLDIAEGALPAGVDVATISVRSLDAAEGGLDAGDGQIVAAFDLQPDGLVFSEPVSFTYDIPFEGGGAYVAMLAGSSRDPEMLDIADMRVDASGTRLTITVPLSHFSTTWALRFADVHVDLRSEFTGDYLIDDSFTVRVRVPRPRVSEEFVLHRERENIDVHLGERPEPAIWGMTYVWESGEPVSDNLFLPAGRGSRGFDGPLEPDRAPVERWFRIDIEADRSFVDVSQTFTCTEAGRFILDFGGSFHLPIRATWLYADGRQKTADDHGAAGGHLRLAGRCHAPATPPPDPTETATATPTQTATPAATATATPTNTAGGEQVELGTLVGPDEVLVFLLDGVFYLPDGLYAVPAHEPFCSHEHVHGEQIRSLIPGSSGEYITRTEHLAECGFGPPNFYVIPDPR